MGSSERPDPVKTLFSNFYNALNAYDLDTAKSVISKIEEQIGTNDSELSACYTKLTLAELKAGKKK